MNADDIDHGHRVGSRTGSDGAASGDEDEQGEQGTCATSSRRREIIIKLTNSSARLGFYKDVPNCMKIILKMCISMRI